MKIEIPKYKYKLPTMDDCFRELSKMIYQSPITTIYKGFQTQMEDNIMTAIHEYGIDVDRDELVKALQYDRNQYEKGFIDGSIGRADAFRAEIAMEIFEEIESLLRLNSMQGDIFTGKYFDVELEADIAELKKKYTGGEDQNDDKG